MQVVVEADGPPEAVVGDHQVAGAVVKVPDAVQAGPVVLAHEAAVFAEVQPAIVLANDHVLRAGAGVVSDGWIGGLQEVQAAAWRREVAITDGLAGSPRQDTEVG